MTPVPVTRTSDTENQYLARGAQLVKDIQAQHLAKFPEEPFTITAFVDGVLAKREDYRPSTWRFNRRAASFTLWAKGLWEPWLTPAVNEALPRLRAAPAIDPGKKREPRTSSGKSKRFTEQQFEAVSHLAMMRRTPNADRLVTFLTGSLLTGLRPCEWPGASFTMSDGPARWILTVRNAKSTNGRALGKHRELRWNALSRDHIAAIDGCIAMGELTNYKRVLSTMSDLLGDLVRTIWPKRTDFPTLYSARHEAMARWKAAYLHPEQTMQERLIGLATIAALAGHLSDETATKHYGRPRRGRDRISMFPVPHPDPDAILDVRHRFDDGPLRREHRIAHEADPDV